MGQTTGGKLAFLMGSDIEEIVGALLDRGMITVGVVGAVLSEEQSAPEYAEMLASSAPLGSISY